MKPITTLIIALLTLPATAADLDSFGLGDVQQLSDSQAETVRGQGASAFGTSSISVFVPQYNLAVSSVNGYCSTGNRQAGGENGSQVTLFLRGVRGGAVNPPNGNGAGFCPNGWSNGVGNPHNCTPTPTPSVRLPTIRIDAFAGGYSSAFSR